MKKLISIMTSIIVVFTLILPVMAYEYNNDTVKVYVTVNDITDIDEPLNTLIERRPLTVSNFDISEYGEQFTGIPILDSGVTYLHVLIALHEELYGKDAVTENLKIDSDGITRIFMGKSVGSIMYKNGKYIFAIPQYVNVYDNDEVNVCLYDEGYNQAIASFDEAYVLAETGETIDFNLFMHHWYPEISEPIEGAEIVDGDGIYITDIDGNIISTDANGDFSITFPKQGLYRLTIAPTVGYYMSSSGGTWVVWYEEVEITETVEKQKLVNECSYVSTSDLDENSAIRKAAEALDAHGVSLGIVTTLNDWMSTSESETADEVRYTNGPENGKYLQSKWFTETYMEEVTRTELVKHEEFVSGEASQKVDYTTPWVVVNVTNELTVTDVMQNGSSITFNAINADKYTGTAYCAAFDENNPDVPAEVKLTSFKDSMSFTFNAEYSKYKLYVWDNTMKPVGTVYAYNPEIKTAAWNFTRAKPENVIITGAN